MKSATLTRLLSPHHRVAITTDSQYRTIEVKIDMAMKPSITISTCCKEVRLNENKGVDIQEVSPRSIDEAMCLVENASPCTGCATNADNESDYILLAISIS